VFSNFHNSCNYKKILFFYKKKLRIPRSFVWSTYFIKYKQSIVKLFLEVLIKVANKIIFNLSLILILILKSFVNTGPVLIER